LPLVTRGLIVHTLEIEADDLYESNTPLGLSCLFQLAGLNRQDMRDTSLSQSVQALVIP
jgi:hypothetical protein